MFKKSVPLLIDAPAWMCILGLFLFYSQAGFSWWTPSNDIGSFILKVSSAGVLLTMLGVLAFLLFQLGSKYLKDFARSKQTWSDYIPIISFVAFFVYMTAVIDVDQAGRIRYNAMSLFARGKR